MSRRILALFAKAPIAGQVKTRLSPPLSPEQAARLYEAMLRDILDQHENSDYARALWFTPAQAASWFADAAPGYQRIPQVGPDLAARMLEVFRRHESENYDRIVLRGTDSPTLPLAHVESAFALLDEVDLVLGPDRDGGFHLIGLRQAHAKLFDVEMSTASVLEQTLDRARTLGLRAELLPYHYDVDVFADLELLRAGADNAPRTARWLAHVPLLS